MKAWIDRVSTAADLDAVLEIETASFFNPTTREWYESELERPDVCYVYVLRTPAHHVAGFCAFWKVVDQIHINNLAVRPELRGHGLGGHMLACVLAEATRLGAPHATLEVRRSNDAARRLYERAGFALAGVRTAYYSNPIEDALILVRKPA
jgi:[ribosomal protein S18]-alanine N-acetyltransferase